MDMTCFWTEFKAGGRRQREEKLIFKADEGREEQVINLYPQVQYQELQGFGGAITEAAAYVYSLLDEGDKTRLLEAYFGRENMRYRFVRIPIDSCDFSLSHYVAAEDEGDRDFAAFSLERVERYIFPMLDDAERAFGGRLPLMLAPWSPPAYMKSNGRRDGGGKLKPHYQRRWAEYICKYVAALRARGHCVKMLSLQNEPKAAQTWESCVYSAEEQKRFLTKYLWPALMRHGFGDIEIFIWDHNKERVYEWAEAMIDRHTDAMIAGIAFHWYSGDHFEALRLLRERFPDKTLALSEACIEFSKHSGEDGPEKAERYAHEIIGNLNEGMSLFLDWNLLLDERGGPNHAKNFCDAPYLFHRAEGRLEARNLQACIRHFSHFLESGARRIAFSRYCDKVELCAFRKNSTITCVFLNRGEEKVPAYLRLNGQCARLNIAPHSVGSAVIRL